jgi:glycosyltransferase involved in cell wall biosynthesis
VEESKLLKQMTTSATHDKNVVRSHSALARSHSGLQQLSPDLIHRARDETAAQVKETGCALGAGISAVMIVRDEEKLLSRCLKSFTGAYDELCIVDTGSTDRTIKIAQRFRAKILSFTACNTPDGKIRDFSLARNAAIELAGGEWILWMDADDVLLEGGVERLRKHARLGKFAGIQVTIRWGQDSWVQTRLFKNEPCNRFVGRVHEFPKVHGKIMVDRGVVVQHLPDKAGKEASFDRNLRMCEAEVKEDPANMRALFYLGNALRLTGRFDEAILRYTQYLALGGNFHSERYTAAHYVALCHCHKAEWQEAIDAGFRALKIDPRYAETHCLIADSYIKQSEYRYARQWYASAIACGKPPADALLFVDETKYEAYPRKRIGLCDNRLLHTHQRGTGNKLTPAGWP